MLQKNLNQIEKKIKENIAPGMPLPKILAVSKKQDVEKIKQLYNLGIHDFAENYLQEAKDKMDLLKDLSIHWHFIGSVQSKKIKDIVGQFTLIHSVDRLETAKKISQKALKLNLNQEILLQVNIASEPTKLGIDPKDLNSFLEATKEFSNITVRGLMIFPPLCETEQESLGWFAKGKELLTVVQGAYGQGACLLSMGTSQDYHLAVQEGANLLRIGETLMGPRA